MEVFAAHLIDSDFFFGELGTLVSDSEETSTFPNCSFRYLIHVSLVSELFECENNVSAFTSYAREGAKSNATK